MNNEDKPHYLQHRKRLKERFLKSTYAVSDAEIVELLLGYVIRGKDVKPQAKMILNECKNLSQIFSVNLPALKGIGAETELFFILLKEFYARMNFQKIVKKEISLSNSIEVYDFLKLKIGYNTKECFLIMFLDTKNRLKHYKIIREGFINSVSMSVRDIIEEAIVHNCLRVIIAHNHPSGDCTPSESDLKITNQISHGLKYTGISLVDHMIVSSANFHSMKAAGQIIIP